MFDHVKFGVSDYAASKAFFLKALEPIGVSVVAEGPPRYGVELSSPEGKASLCLFETEEKPAHLHLAFTAENRQQVDAFYRAAMDAGGAKTGRAAPKPVEESASLPTFPATRLTQNGREQAKEDRRSGTIAVHRLEAASLDFDNQMATFHFLGELGSKPGPMKTESAWKRDPNRHPKNVRPTNDEMNFIFPLDAFSWKAMQRTASSPRRIRPQADKAATGASRVCHPHVGCVAKFPGLAAADLGSR